VAGAYRLSSSGSRSSAAHALVCRRTEAVACFRRIDGTAGRLKLNVSKRAMPSVYRTTHTGHTHVCSHNITEWSRHYLHVVSLRCRRGPRMSPVRRPGCALSPLAGQTHAKPLSPPPALVGVMPVLDDVGVLGSVLLAFSAAKRSAMLVSVRRPLYLLSSVDFTEWAGPVPLN
jgi:hypothetical protein